MIRHATLLAATLFVVPALATAEPLSVVAFNVESGGADAHVIGGQIEELQADPATRADLWALSEVNSPFWATTFEEAATLGAGVPYEGILGSTGGGDRLLILFNTEKLQPVRHFELDEMNIGGNVRAPLVGQFRVLGSGQEFLFVVNHLYRSRPERRLQQAEMLHDWAEVQTLPVITAGDFNFDWAVPGGEFDHDPAFDRLTEDGVFHWTQPAALVPTHCSHFSSVLDFVFVAGDARDWSGTSQILFAEDDYCPDDSETSDHRPVLATFELDRGLGLRGVLLARIDSIETELHELRDLVAELE